MKKTYKRTETRLRTQSMKARIVPYTKSITCLRTTIPSRWHLNPLLVECCTVVLNDPVPDISYSILSLLYILEIIKVSFMKFP
jgi:hypothetical protein